MKLIIVEDEWLAAQRLQHLLKAYDPAIEILAVSESVEETVRLLRAGLSPDLMLLDVQLSDGHSFEIFNQVRYNNPVIFTTAYDNYVMDAFKLFSIDYILKPVTVSALGAALDKCRNIVSAWRPDYTQLASALLEQQKKSKFKERLLAKIGQKLFFIETENIAYFQADNKIVYLVDKQGNRYVVDYTMEKLMSILDDSHFFRLNRKYIVRVSAIEHIKPFYNNRLKICLKGSGDFEDMIISRERVADFREWAESAG